MDRRLPKAIFLDEAWAITSTPEGAKLVPEVSRMGRSRNTALILVSQNAGDLLAEQVTNCISSVFAFRSSERVEVGNVMALLGAEPTPEHLAVLRGLGNGECIFRDLEGRVGRIGIDLISDEMRAWLDTNPTRSRPTDGPPAKDAAPAGAVQGEGAADADAAPGQDHANGPAGAGRTDGTALVAGATAQRGGGRSVGAGAERGRARSAGAGQAERGGGENAALGRLADRR
jgi:hypothetical protein